jgi:hypothetical protein
MTLAPAPTPQKALLLGDVHGRAGWFAAICEEARRRGCDALVQVGDLGYGVGDTPEALAFPARLEEELTRYGLSLFFVDGNHDNFDLLLDPTKPLTAEGFRQLSPRVFYIPRATRWSWHGVRYLALGGAYSLDRRGRDKAEELEQKARVWWWPEERISEGDLYRSLDGPPVDVLLTHDAPLEARLPGAPYPSPPTEANRRYISTLAARLKPRLLVHGHWHVRYQDVYRPADGPRLQVIGLSRDGDWPGCFAELDLVALREQLR